MFDDLGLRTSPAFDCAYEEVEQFTKAFSKREKSAHLLKGLLLERLAVGNLRRRP